MDRSTASQPPKVLVVDDEPAITVALAKKLRREGYDCVTAGSAEEALSRLRVYLPDVVISDVRMPGMSGLELLKEVKKHDPDIKVILITAYAEIDFVVEALRHQADDYLLKPFNLKELASSVARALEGDPWNQAHSDGHHESPMEQTSTLAILGLARAMELRDQFARGHVERVAKHARTMGMAVGLGSDQLRDLWLAAVLHDIGKLSVPESILNKPATLDDEEWGVVRRYPQAGALVVEGIPDLEPARLGVLHHREHWDGSGYPLGVQQEAISLAGRIVGLVEAFDAMTHDRPYRAALSRGEALQELEAGRGGQFDPELLDTFLALLQAVNVA